MSRYKPTYFSHSDFDSPDAPGSGVNMQDSFLMMLDNARSIAATMLKSIVFIIVSGFRTRARQLYLRKKFGNKAALTSAHESGLAADIRATTIKEARIILTACFKAGFRRFGIMANSIHVDSDSSRPTPSCYTYSTTPQARYNELKALFDKLIEEEEAKKIASQTNGIPAEIVAVDEAKNLATQSDVNWELLGADLVQFVKQWAKAHGYLLIKAKKV